MPQRPRVLYILREYPQLSETYIQTEMDAISDKYDIRVIANKDKPADQPQAVHHPYEMISFEEPEKIREVVEDFKPNVMHTHWMHAAPVVAKVSKTTGVPFTIRAHSFDVLWKWKELNIWKKLRGKKAYPGFMTDLAPHLQSDRCLGVLTFPFGRENLEKAGMPSNKLYDAPACLNYKRFYNTGPNEDGVMNGGAALPKKKMDDFIKLATLVPGKRFDLYPIGYKGVDLEQINAAKGSPVTITPNVQPTDMPPLYKQHRWLVYTASTDIPTTGWPVMLAEAQASGVGVLMKNLRPDLKDYVGPCGYLYDTVEEAAKIISQPFPEEKRQQGFENARKNDIELHIHLLTDLWEKAISPSAR